jgi:hypothetical protein
VRAAAAVHSARERTLTETPAGELLERDATGPQLDHLERVFAAVGPEAMQGWRKVIRGFAETALSAAPESVRDLIDEQDRDD